MAGKLGGKIALVTGAASGMGKATAIAFAREGAKVVLADIRGDTLEAATKEVRAVGGEAVATVGDASKDEDCKRWVDKAMNSFGGLHVAFNSHGVMCRGQYASTSEADITRTLDVNLKSYAFCFKYQIPAMAKSGGNSSIIVNSSVTGSHVVDANYESHVGVYAASKAGMDMLMKYAAIEGGVSGIRVNSIAPGLIDTPLVSDLTLEMKEYFLKNNQIIDRIIKPEEIAKLVVFLASDDAAMITGSVYPIDAGAGVKG